MAKSQKLTILTALYLVQGLPYGFFTMALPVLLRKADLSLPQIGLTSLLTLPWAIKFIWAPAFDRYEFRKMGLRRSWLIPIQLLSVLVYALLAQLKLDARDTAIILGAFLLSNLLAASQDIATDALAVDILVSEERGWANAIKVAAYRGGMIIGGWLLLSFYDQLGWSGTMATMAGLSALCTIPVFLYKEGPKTNRRPMAATFVRDTFEFFYGRGALQWTIVLLIYKFGHAAASAMIRVWLVDQGYELAQIGWILGSGGFVAGFFGAIVGGWIATRGNRRNLLVSLGALQVAGVASYLWPVLTAHATEKVFIAASLDNFTSGLETTVLFTLMMDACRKIRAASDFTAQACTVVVSQTAAAVFAGFAAQAWGYPTFFVACGAIAFTSLAITAWILKSEDVCFLLDPKKESV